MGTVGVSQKRGDQSATKHLFTITRLNGDVELGWLGADDVEFGVQVLANGSVHEVHTPKVEILWPGQVEREPVVLLQLICHVTRRRQARRKGGLGQAMLNER